MQVMYNIAKSLVMFDTSYITSDVQHSKITSDVQNELDHK